MNSCYTAEMVVDLINKLDDPDLDGILIMEKAKPTGGKPAKPPKPKGPKSAKEKEEEKKNKEEERTSKNFACYLNFGEGDLDYHFIQGWVKF